MMTIYNPLEKLSPRHYAAMRRIICGDTTKEICEEMGWNSTYLTMLKSDPLFAAELKAQEEKIKSRFVEAVAKGEVVDPVRDELDKAKVEAIRMNIELMKNATSEAVRQRSAWDILDRAGYKPTEKVESTTKVVVDDKNMRDLEAGFAFLRTMQTPSPSGGSGAVDGNVGGATEES
jgi:hypothetical protein